MLRISNIPLGLTEDERALPFLAAKTLGCHVDDLGPLTIIKKSLDARKKQDIRWVYTVEVSLGTTMSQTEAQTTPIPTENALFRRLNSPNVTVTTHQLYQFPPVRRTSPTPPVVVGMGPAGLFAAYLLAKNGLLPVILERGMPVENRTIDVENYWKTGVLDPNSNVQFGEGGAGAFSDGKLTTGTHDPRLREALRTLVNFGAPSDILYSYKPHIGTDVLRKVLKNIRGELLRLGCDLRMGHRLTGLGIKDGSIQNLEITALGISYHEPCDALILAPGHSARDTFAMLRAASIPLAPKAFAVGVRVEHPQELVSKAQYGPQWQLLPPADYKLACHLPNGRSAFTFCVCPGGVVVASASGEGQVVTNGMSCRARDGRNINGGLLVNVIPEDFGGDDPLAGVAFQERWERAAFALGGADAKAPAQTVGDFLAGKTGTVSGLVQPSYRPGVTWTDLTKALPAYVSDTLRGALPLLDKKLHGFADGGAVLTGIESRSSSPVRILRGEDCQSPVRGLYPCGEGAGYAGGILSAAVDGMRVAEAVASRP